MKRRKPDVKNEFLKSSGSGNNWNGIKNKASGIAEVQFKKLG